MASFGEIKSNCLDFCLKATAQEKAGDKMQYLGGLLDGAKACIEAYHMQLLQWLFWLCVMWEERKNKDVFYLSIFLHQLQWKTNQNKQKKPPWLPLFLKKKNNNSGLLQITKLTIIHVFTVFSFTTEMTEYILMKRQFTKKCQSGETNIIYREKWELLKYLISTFPKGYTWTFFFQTEYYFSNSYLLNFCECLLDWTEKK